MSQTVERFDLAGLRGLDRAEAARRLAADGANELPTQRPRGLFRIAFEVLREPMFILLVTSAALYFLMGEPADGALLLGSVSIVITITILQERRTERALVALRDLSSPRALVIREGAFFRVAGREVVRGDLLVLREGDRVPADALLRRAANLTTDESALTGESVPVRKNADAAVTTLQPPGGDDLASVFGGSLVTSGQGVAEVVATGAQSQLGAIGKALQKLKTEPTPLQQETGRLVRVFAVAGMAACAVIVIAYAITRGGGSMVWKQGLLAGIAMAMSLLPEEFPVVLTVFLALGAWRISRHAVLTRRMPAVETLGSTTVLCVDKTGTLTENRMSLRCLALADRTIDLQTLTVPLPEEVHDLLEQAILASKPDPFDPMERAVRESGERLLGQTEHLHPDWTLTREYPLSPGLLAVSHAWRTAEGELRVASKGAPEAIADLCHLEPSARAAFLARAKDLAAAGLRVLGVARGVAALSTLPDEHHDLHLTSVGLLGFADPLRPSVPAAVAECRAAGIRVVMITGDYPETAQSIAQQAGIDGALLTGDELDAMSDEALARAARGISIFARVVPTQKLRIVEALKASGEIVAMTGDGVNDAPALKAAHIGVAMGQRGTDVAREAASLVLLEDDFASIVTAIRYGRRIFDNIRKAVAFILAVHVPIAGLAMLPVFFADWPLLLLPIHVVFLELIIDPACSLVFEAEDAEADLMRRPPRSPHERLFSLRMVALSTLQGAAVFVACITVFLLARQNHAPEAARALTFAALIIAILMLITVNRSSTESVWRLLRTPNAAFRWVVGATLLVLTMVLFVPVVQRRFQFGAVHPPDLALSLTAGFLSVMWFEVRKRVRRHGLSAPDA